MDEHREREGERSPTRKVIDVPPGAPRPLAALTYIRKAYPEMWRNAEQTVGHLAASAGTAPGELGTSYCDLPNVFASLVITADYHGRRLALDEGEAMEEALTSHPLGSAAPDLLSALVSWRQTKGVYRFDLDVLRELWEETEGSEKVPIEMFSRLPERCPYIAIPEDFGSDDELLRFLRGFWVYRNYLVEVGECMVFLLDFGDPPPEADLEGASGGSIPSCSLGYEAFLLPLVSDDIGACVAVELEAMQEKADRDGSDIARYLRAHQGELAAERRALLSPLISTTLYLCAANAEIAASDGSSSRPGEAPPNKRTKKKRKQKPMAAAEVREWDVAYRIGADLRRTREKQAKGSSGDGDGGRTLRSHIRRAHYHTYLTGPKEAPTRILKWLAPIPVNVDDADYLPAVIREVEE